MVNFKNLSGLANRAKDAVEKRGGTDALKQDAAQLKGIAKGPGSLSEKAKAAAAALKEGGPEKQASTAGTSEAPTSATEPKATGARADAPKPAAKADTPKQDAGKAKADAAAKTGTATTGAGKQKPPAEEVGGAK